MNDTLAPLPEPNAGHVTGQWTIFDMTGEVPAQTPAARGRGRQRITADQGDLFAN